MGNNISNISQIENKAIETKPKFIFNMNDALIELNKAEQSDNYIHKCTTSWSNRTSRINNKYEPYENTKNDIKDDIIELLPKWLPYNTKIILLNSNADNGMPHTRPNIICLPYNESLLKNKSTLFHESIHIHQRILPQVWQLVYEKAWKMKRWNFELPDTINKYRRYNPDTIMDGLYVWNDEWVVVPVYLRKDKPELDRIRLHFYNVKTGNIIGYIPQDWKDFFGTDLGDSEQEHPNEMAAYSLQKYFYKKERKPNNLDKLLYVYIKQYFPEIFSY